jgi:hypothetical protein
MADHIGLVIKCLQLLWIFVTCIPLQQHIKLFLDPGFDKGLKGDRVDVTARPPL